MSNLPVVYAAMFNAGGGMAATAGLARKTHSNRAFFRNEIARLFTF
jgi:hypothetical protein